MLTDTSLQTQKPVTVKFKVVKSPREERPTNGQYFKDSDLDWGAIFRDRLAQQYPDMRIERSIENDVEYFMIRPSHSTRPGYIEERVFDFLRKNPAMKISGFQMG